MGTGSGAPLVPVPPPEGARRVGRVGQVLSGLAWNSAGQIATLAINVGLTPFILHRLGSSRYGLFALVSTLTGLASNLDGGLGPAASRFFAIRVGAGDHEGQSSLLVTLLCLLTLVTGAVAALGILAAPAITSVFDMAPALRSQATTILRLFLVLGVVSALQQAFGNLLRAEHRWGLVAGIGIAAAITNAALVVVLLDRGTGLVGMFWAAVGAQLVAFVGVGLAVGRRLAWEGLRFLPRAEVKELIHYSTRVQAAAVASSFTNEANALLLGVLFPVRYVAYYSIGSNFATQLVTLPTNAIAPIGVTLSRTFGASSLRATVEEFTRLQRLWVRSVAAVPFIGAASAYFAIDRWLGSGDRLAGAVAAILLVGQAVALLSLVMDSVVKAVNHPEIESRYLAVGAAVKVAVALALAVSVGMLGVPIGTGVGAVVSVAYFLRLTRRRLRMDLRSFLPEVPKAALAVSVVVTLLLELPAFLLAPNGVGGLVVCAVPAAIGLGVYALVVGDVRAPLRALVARASVARAPSSGP